MAKNTFLSFSTTAGGNTDVGGIGILGSNAVSNFDNALRTLMAILRGDLDNGTVFVTKSAGYTAVAGDNNTFYEFTATATLALTAAATLAADWHMTVFANGGVVTIDPNGAETINGAASLVLADGDAAIIICTGSAFKAVVVTAAANMAVKYAVKTGNYTALNADTNTSIRFTSAATLAFDVSANLRTNWRIEVWNDSTGNVTIDPNSTDTINGAATLVLQPRQKAEIFKTGSTTFQASIFGDPLSGPHLQGYAYGLSLSTNATDAANDVDIAAGAAGSDSSPFYLLQLSSTLTKRIDAAWAVGNDQGGLDTGSVTNATYYIWLIQRSDTLVTDVLFSLSSTAPTMPTNYDRKRLLGYLVRAAATNSPLSMYMRPLTEVVGNSPAYGCRAWVNFNGTGTVANRASGNVSSITDNGTGNYTVKFISAMPDANYSVQMSFDPDIDAVAQFSGPANPRIGYVQESFKTTSSFRIFTGGQGSTGTTLIDFRAINAIVMR